MTIRRHYERLGAMDSSLLVFETPETHMHLGGVAIFEAGPLEAPSGGIDIARVQALIAARLHLIPRYRQRLAWIPFHNHPVWVDDEHFNLSYHIRHTSLPRPGDEPQLKRLTGRLMSQQLDRGRPLWEAWIVEGLEGNRFALVTKIHHCMADGIAAVDLLTVLLNPSPDETVEEPASWIPRPVPRPGELLRDELARQLRTPLDALESLREAFRHPLRAVGEAGDVVVAALELIGRGLPSPPETPLNQPIGPHRRFDWTGVDLHDVKAVKNQLGGTVNDVVLTTVTLALARFLERRGLSVESLEDYRVIIPVNVRTAEERGVTNNRASAWLTALPLAERDPVRCYRRIRTTTARLKATKQALGPDAFLRLAEGVNPLLVTLGVRLTARLKPYNLIITNVPGPPLPVYMLGSRLLTGYPLAPLFENQGLAVALFSYDGKLFFGLNADWDLVPDLHWFTRAIAEGFQRLHAAAASAGAVEPARARLKRHAAGTQLPWNP